MATKKPPAYAGNEQYQALVKRLTARPARCLWQVPGPAMARGEASLLEAWVIAGQPGIFLVHAMGSHGVDVYSNAITTGIDWSELDALLGPTEDVLRARLIERGDMRIHLVMNQGAPDEVDTTLASLLRNDDGIREDEDLVRRLRGMGIGELIEDGGGAVPVWTARRVAKPTEGNGEEVTCDCDVHTSNQRYLKVEVHEGIARVKEQLPARLAGWHEVATYTWQGSLVDRIDEVLPEGDFGPDTEREIEDAIRAAWAKEA